MSIDSEKIFPLCYALYYMYLAIICCIMWLQKIFGSVVYRLPKSKTFNFKWIEKNILFFANFEISKHFDWSKYLNFI